MIPKQDENVSFPDLIYARGLEKKTYYDEAHFNLVGDFVTMAKRNDGDYMGVMKTKHRNQWLGILNKGFFTYPVISRSIRSKTATAVSTGIQFDITPAINLPEKKAGAEVAENVYKYCNKYHWTERVETMVAMLGQMGKFTAILNEKDETNGIRVGTRAKMEPAWLKSSDDLIGCMDCGAGYTPDQLNLAPKNQAEPEMPVNENPAEYSQLGEAGPLDNPAESPDGRMWDNPDERLKDYPPMPEPNEFDLSGARCLNPDCGSGNLGIHDIARYEPGQKPTGEKEAIIAAKIKQTVISPLLIRYDDLHTIGFDWQKAHWFNYHPIESVYEIISDCPEAADEISGGNYREWSESARWYMELSKANGNIAAPFPAQQSILNELVEPDYWFWEPVMCGGWTEPEGWELKKKGEIVFSIAAGETIEEACRRSFQTDDFRGVMVKMVGKTIVDVKNISFLDCLTLIGWSVSATTHVPAGDERLIQLQDAATRVFSMVYSCVQRLSIPKGWADGRVWNLNDLNDQQPGKWMLSKQDINPDDLPRGIQGSLGYLSPQNPSNLVEVFINLIIQIAKEESGVFDETVGSNNTQNQTASGRATALNQSLSLLTPTQKAKKEGKIAWVIVMLKIWQTMPDEAFVLIKGSFEEEWKAEDIAAFKELDIENELIIEAVEGTDVPKTRPQMLVNFQIAAEMRLLAPNPMIDPELQQYILKNVLMIDFDMGNIDAERRLAARRLEAMREIADEFVREAKIGYDQLIQLVNDPVTGMPTRQLHSDLKLTYAQNLRTKVEQEDNHAAYTGYYIDQRKGITGGREPREIDVLILNNALDMHYQIIAEKAKNEALAKEMSNQPTIDPASGAEEQGSENQSNV